MTKPRKWHVRLAKTQISLGIRLSAQRRLWSDSADAQLIRVFAGHTDHIVGFVMPRLIGRETLTCVWTFSCVFISNSTNPFFFLTNVLVTYRLTETGYIWKFKIPFILECLSNFLAVCIKSNYYSYSLCSIYCDVFSALVNQKRGKRSQGTRKYPNFILKQGLLIFQRGTLSIINHLSGF